MLMLRRRGVRELFVVSNGFFKFQYQYSTISTSDGAATAKKAHSMVDYLINSLRFSREEAVSVSSVSKDYGFSDEDVVKFFLRKPRLPNLTPEWLKGRLDCVEEKLGIARSSPNFKYAVMVAFCYKESTMEKKKQVFGSFGWSESEVSTLLSINPLTFTKSEADIRDKLNFFMVELGYTPSYLIRYNIFLVLSLEKRVKPRYEVWKTLKEKKLVGSKLFVTVAVYSEPRFLEFVQRFENEVPSLSQTYISSRS